MKIELTYSKTIGAVKKEFHDAFPYLKLEFFHERHRTGEGSEMEKEITDDTRLWHLMTGMKEGTIEINPEHTVRSIEQRFQNEFGMPVQVFRLMNNTWIETTETDNLTLARQNEIGYEAAHPVRQRFDTFLQDN